jgi:hypothetical protein
VNGQPQRLDPGTIVIRYWTSARLAVSVGRVRQDVTTGVIDVVSASAINCLLGS